MREIIREKMADSLSSNLPSLTRRDADVPAIRNKAHAVIGMRRTGKSCFLHQCMSDRLKAGTPRDALLYFSFEDERLEGMQAAQLHWVLEEYFQRFPQYRDQRQVAFFFDEIQVVPGWETFVRRILDSEKAEVFVSGSSAKLLSREVATALRGRGTETVIFPFSFREFLRHHGVDTPQDTKLVPKAQRSHIEKRFRDYLTVGGFPEAQGLAPRDALVLLQGYVDIVVFRDVIERHQVTNVIALRRLVRQLLAAPTGEFSINRIYNDMRSQGIAVAKDSLHEMLSHLEDAFLVQTLPMATSSERQRQVNPRKVYPIDPGLIPAFDRSGKANIGQALETFVFLELKRRAHEVAYFRTPSGFEIDFLATSPGGRRELFQVAAGLSDPATRARELRAIADARTKVHRLPTTLLTMASADIASVEDEAPRRVKVRAAWEWALSGK